MGIIQLSSFSCVMSATSICMIDLSCITSTKTSLASLEKVIEASLLRASAFLFWSLLMCSIEPASSASYSASLLVVLNSNLMAYVYSFPYGLTSIRFALEPSELEAPSVNNFHPFSGSGYFLLASSSFVPSYSFEGVSARKSASICPLTEFLPLNSILCSPNSIAHLAIRLNFSGLLPLVVPLKALSFFERPRQPPLSIGAFFRLSEIAFTFEGLAFIPFLVDCSEPIENFLDSSKHFSSTLLFMTMSSALTSMCLPSWWLNTLSISLWLIFFCFTGSKCLSSFTMWFVLKASPLIIIVLGTPVMCAVVHVKTSTYALKRGSSPIVVSKGTSPSGQDFSPEKPTKGIFESLRRDQIEGGCSKFLAAFFVARISLGLLDRLESSPWLGPRYGENLSLPLCPWLLSQEDLLGLLKFSLRSLGVPLVAISLASI
ncbi:hypothetical protein Tco_0620268 [Tanacetum coccineum]